MNELLIAILIILICALMFGAIYLILKANNKVIELNGKVEEFKNTDFSSVKKIVEILNKVNKYVNFGKVKYYFEVFLTTVTAANLVVLIKKLSDKNKQNKSE